MVPSQVLSFFIAKESALSGNYQYIGRDIKRWKGYSIWNPEGGGMEKFTFQISLSGLYLTYYRYYFGYRQYDSRKFPTSLVKRIHKIQDGCALHSWTFILIFFFNNKPAFHNLSIIPDPYGRQVYYWIMTENIRLCMNKESLH